jgi:gliding motility associated protien GldN
MLLQFNAGIESVFSQIPYVYVREADVMWSKRIWRVIDLREKMNLPLYYPLDDLPERSSLFRVIQKGLSSGKISKVFDFDVFTNEFGAPLTRQQVLNRMTETIDVKDPEGNPLVDADGKQVTIQDTLKPDRIMQYWIKEEWFFDKQRSVLDVRIIAIAPVIETGDPESGRFSYKPLFWLYYPDCRTIFAENKVYNPWNDSQWLSFDELFQKRFFSSYINQESNVYGRPISAYAQGAEALFEAERIKESIFKWEDDLWHY